MAFSTHQLLPTPTGSIYPRNPHFLSSNIRTSTSAAAPWIKTFPIEDKDPFVTRWSEVRKNIKAIIEKSDLTWRSVHVLKRGTSGFSSATITIFIQGQPSSSRSDPWHKIHETIYNAIGWESLVVETYDISPAPRGLLIVESMIVPRGFEGPLVWGFEKCEMETVLPGPAYGGKIGALTKDVMRKMWRVRGGV